MEHNKFSQVFFVGIGGIGISAVARLMLRKGISVSGSDITANSFILEELKKLGADIKKGQGVELIPPTTDLIVYSIAVSKYDPGFFEQLKNTSIKMLSYPEMLGYLTEDKYTIAVSGTHGKTTTTAMIAKILIDTNRDPSVIVGSLLKESKSNLIIGQSDFFVVEACEYERSFLNIKPKILIITNIEPDHLDYYKDLPDIQNAFGQLIAQTNETVIYNNQDVNTSVLMQRGENKKNKNRTVDYSKYLEKVPKLLIPGLHNKANAAAALAVADFLNIKMDDAQKSIAEFPGIWRRLEKKSETNAGTIVYDDYAHHPTEIKASIEALRELYPENAKKITILFQPHLYSRTRAFFDDFAKSFKGADLVLLLPIYFAREKKDENVSSEKLAKAISLAGEKAQSFLDFQSAENFVSDLALGPEDVFVTMGAGEAYKVAEKIFKII